MLFINRLMRQVCVYAISLLCIWGVLLPDTRAQQTRTVETQPAEKKESSISFETRDTLNNINLEDYKPMPLPELDTTQQTTLTEQERRKYERVIEINLETGEQRMQPVQKVEDSEGSQSRPGFEGLPMHSGTDQIENGSGDAGGESLQTFNALSQVGQPTQGPWHQNVKLFINFPGGGRTCSGALIDYEWVLTAGHCVHQDDLGGNANSISVAPGFDRGSRPFGTISADQANALNGWINNSNFNYDMAWIHLDYPVGFKTGFFGTGYNSNNSYFYNNTFVNPGFPGGSFSNAQIMYTWRGTFDSQFWRNETRALYQDRRSYDGQSGSGVYERNASPKIQYGTLSSGNSNWTRYARITQSRFNEINNDIANSRPSNLELVSMRMKASPDRLVEGDKIKNMSFILANRSTASQSGSWNIEIYLSNDRDISAADTRLSTQSLSTTFNAESYKNVNLHPVTIPFGVSGTKFVGVIVNASDANTNNNETDDIDAKQINITPSHTVHIKSNNPNSGVNIFLYKKDNRGRTDGVTSFDRRYSKGTSFKLWAPSVVGTHVFEQWDKNGIKKSEKQEITATMGSSNFTVTARYTVPDIPLKPYQIGEQMPEYYTQSDRNHIVKIVNEHSTTLNWTASESASWLSVSPSSGSTPAGDSTTVTVTFSSDNQKQGFYTEDIVFSSSDAGVSNNSITANLRVGHVPGSAPSPEKIYKHQQIAQRDLLGMGLGVDPLENFVGMGSPGIGNGNSGGCPMLRWSDGKLVMDQLLTPSEAIDGAHFGQAVSVFTAGGASMAIIGAPGGTNRYKRKKAYGGRIHLFKRGNTEWTEQSSHLPDRASTDGSRFGSAIDAAPVPGSDDTEYFVAVGAPGVTYEGSNSVGSVFIYRVTSTGITGPTTLNPEILANGMNMGHDVSIDTQGGRVWLTVGVPARENSERSGHVLIYEYSGGSWTQQQMLDAKDPQPSHHFGTSVAVEWSEVNPTIAVGVPNSSAGAKGDGLVQTFRYSYDQGTWVFDKKLTMPEPRRQAGLGTSLSLFKAPNRIVLLAGAPGIEREDYGGESFIYQNPDGGNSWQHRSTLRSEKLDGNSSLGRSLSVLPVNGKLQYLTGTPGYNGDSEDEGGVFSYQVPNVTSLPAFEVKSSTLNARLQEDDSTSASLVINSTGEAELTWELAGKTPEWITLEKKSGGIAAGATANIDVLFNSIALDPGIYTFESLLETNSTAKDCLYVEMKMKVIDRPEIDLSLTEWMSRSKDTVEAGTRIPLSSEEVLLYNRKTDPVDSVFHVGLYASQDSSLGGASLLSSVTVDTNLKGETPIALDFAPGAHLPEKFGGGNVYLVMAADNKNKVPELDETNNRLWHSIYVTEARHPSFAFLSDQVSVEATLGKEETDTRELGFRNSGVETLSFSIPAFAEESARNTITQTQKTSHDTIPPYLENIEPGSGRVAVGDSGSITLTLNAKGVAANTYQDTMHIVTDDPDRRSVPVPIEVVIKESTSLPGDNGSVPKEFALGKNYPNPFNPETVIRYALPKATEVDIKVYNTIGRHVRTLVNDQKKAGYHTVRFNGGRLTSGVYLYRIRAGDFQSTRKMLLIK